MGEKEEPFDASRICPDCGGYGCGAAKAAEDMCRDALLRRLIASEKAREEAERERDAAWSNYNDRRDGSLIFQSQIHSALDRSEPSNHNDGILNRVIRIVDRALAAESRASSLSCELLAATKARNCADERAQTMRLMLDTIEGWATGQPGKMPTAVEDGWSTALSAAVARVAAAESRAARLLTAMREIEGKTGHFGEAPPPPEWMPMLSLIAWVGKTARATLAEVKE